MLRKRSAQKFYSITLSALIALVIFFGFIHESHAQLQVVDTAKAIRDAQEKAQESAESALLYAGRISLLNSLRAVVNQMAYQTATYIGSGGKGQKPLFFTEPFGEWMLKQGNNAAGDFIERFTKNAMEQGQKDGSGTTYDICAPDLSVSLKISLGLSDYANVSGGLKESRCSLTNIYKSIEGQMEGMYGSAEKREAWFKNLAEGSFGDRSTDLGAAFKLFGAFDEKISADEEAAKLDRTETGGWKSVVETISGGIIASPKTIEKRQDTAQNMLTTGFWKESGDIFVDAANIFLNQLAISAFNRLMDSLGRSTSFGNNASNFSAQGNTGGISEIEQRASTILQAKFNERSDYDIVGQLSSCTNEEQAGPTNCVITQQFAQAINDRLTVGEALSGKAGGNRSGGGLLDGSKRLGFDQQGNEFSYLSGYPYRSLIILRKYRILPVGWEVAAQYIKNHPQETKDVTLGDLVACFSKDDDAIYPGYYQPWCDGLIDPSWVLKAPKNYCSMEGYGPEIAEASTTPSTIGYCSNTEKSCINNPSDCLTNGQKCSQGGNECSGTYDKCNFTIGRDVQVTRKSNYCADEQSCIKENINGSCSNYGYCTEEKRRWVFNQDQSNTCEPRNNSCQSFRSETGEQVSYLQNTLDYSNCGANQVGCKQYATTGTYTVTPTAKVTWDDVNNQRYFNQRMTDCDPSSEGCHEFIRTADNLDTNLIADGSFESSVCVEPAGGSESKLPNEKNPLINSANAQLASGCILSTMSTSGYLPSPNSRWYIKVSSGSVKAGITNDIADNGRKSLYVEGNGGLYSSMGSTAELLPIGFTLEPERFYTLIAVVRPTAGKVRVGFGLGSSSGQFAESTVTDSWQNLVVNFYAPLTNIPDNIYIQGTDASAKFYIDSVKLTVGESTTAYNEYYTSNLIYEKLLPPYLELTCYQTPGSDFKLKTNAPPVCFDFARKCNADEVGCKKYVSALSGIQVTAKTKPKDFCPTSCVGYNIFVQQANNFNAMQSAYFIPSTARSCAAQAVGCTAFTNLDKLAEGGEAVEYFSYMRSCMKPDALSCDSFYTWEGSDESGYQLKTFSLKKNGSEPASTMSAAQEALVCNADVFKKSPSEPGFNYDCREFYGRDGTVSYHLYSRTISCSDDCHPYRREVASSAICTAGGGTWDATQSRCLHYAIPSEGTTCAAAQVGCQEYTGNVAGNVRTIFVNGFENASTPTDGWSGGSQSNNSLNLGGHSLQTFQDVPLLKTVGADVERNMSYTVSFLAKAQSTTTSVNAIDFINKNDESAVFDTSGSSISNSEWKLYTFNLSNLNHEITPVGSGGGDAGPGAPEIGEKLRIRFNAPVFVDNIRLTEVPNRYYLIKDSWKTPDECDQDMNGNYALRFMLGCSQYKDVDNRTVNLHSFSQLCQDSAAGCEQMIDTNNSSDNRKRLYNDTNNNGSCDVGEDSCVQVAADTMTNVVFDKNKFCDSGLKGCSRLGQANKYETTVVFSDVYKRNNPDNYNTTICSSAAVGCSQYNDKNGGVTYFKDPGNEVCEWRARSNATGQFGWFKKKINRCGGVANGAICSSNSDCGVGQSCSLYSADIDCPVSSEKTIGQGNQKIVQPTRSGTTNWAGYCEATQASCTEYIDPLSKINDNMIVNADYQNLDATSTKIEYWNPGTASPSSLAQTQNVILQPHTVYILKGARGSGTTEASVFCAPTQTINNQTYTIDLKQLQNNNEFVSQSSHSTDEIVGEKSLEFYLQIMNTDRFPTSGLSCTITRSKGVEGESISLRSAIVEYQLADSLDRTSPNGIVNDQKGQVLFNERGQSGTQKTKLTYNADLTYETHPTLGHTPERGSPENANVILKVQPDRVCSKWLSCKTFLPDPTNPNRKTCLDIGLCDSLDSQGNCNNFIELSPSTQYNQNLHPQSPTPPMQISNLTGYSKVGYGVNGNILQDFYNIAAMTQIGDNVQISNGTFENGPSAWNFTASGSSVPQILDQPYKISAERLEPLYVVKQSQATSDFLVPEGRAILKLPSPSISTPTIAESEEIKLVSGRRYVITFYSYSKGPGLNINFKSQTGAGDFTIYSVGANDPQNIWTKQAIGFKASADRYKISIEKSDSGDAYLDDIRIEQGLNNRCMQPNGKEADCGDPANSAGVCSGNGASCSSNSNCPAGQACLFKRPQFIGSTCRLYANQNSLSCLYTDQDDVTHKGIRGYCLENDPKDPGTCLLWYPVNKIGGDTNEEGTNISFDGHNIYYCIDASNGCRNQCSDNGASCVNNSDCTSPATCVPVAKFFCNQFVKVDTSSYWNRRLSPGTSFKMPDMGGHCSGTVTTSCTSDANCPTGQTCVASANAPFPENPIFYSDFPTATRKIDFGISNVKVPALTWGLGHRFFSAYESTVLPVSEQQFINVNPNPPYNIANSFIPYYGASNTNLRCSNQTIYNVRSDSTDPIKNVPNVQFYGHSMGYNDPPTPITFPIEGNWDRCVAIGAQDVDFEPTNQPSNKANQITNAKQANDCGIPTDTRCCVRWNQFHTSCLQYQDNCSICSTGYSAVCSVQATGDRTWSAYVTDASGDGDDPACVTYCYNGTGDYQIIKNQTAPNTGQKQALDLVFRLFPKLTNTWKLETWQNGAYTTKDFNAANVLGGYIPTYPLNECPASGRPIKSSSNNNDYCFVSPTIANLKANGGTNTIFVRNSENVTLSFDTHTDPEQLPLKEITIDWGYKIFAIPTPIRVTTPLTGNFADINPRALTKLYRYNEVATVENGDLFHENDPACGGSAPTYDSCYILTPTVTIKDNWGKTPNGGAVSFSPKIIIKAQ